MFFFVTCLLIVILAAVNSNAQTRLGAGIGFNSFNIQLMEEVEGHKYPFLSGDNFALWGNQIGIAGEKAFNEKWATHLAIVYSWQNTINVKCKRSTRDIFRLGNSCNLFVFSVSEKISIE